MNPDEFNRRLSEISTQWTAVIQAHQASTTTAGLARTKLLLRYGGSVFRYLLGAVRDTDAAEELSQEFVVRLLRGDFHRADPERGRFRDYVKTALINQVNDYFRSQQKRPRALESVAPDPADPALDKSDIESSFENCWREELLEHTWMALNEARPNYYAVLRLRVENPDMSAREIASQLETDDKPMTTDTVRKTLQRARAKFAELLVDEVAAALSTREPQAIEAELKELNLLRYCSNALERRK